MSEQFIGGPPRGRRSRRPSRIEKLQPKSTSFESHAEQSRRRGRRDFGEQRRRSMRLRKRLIAFGAIFGVLVLVGLAAGLFFISDINDRLRGRLVADDKAVELLAQGKTIEIDDPFYVLMVGVDSRQDGERSRADTIIVARIDPKQRSATLISIPRDTYVSIPGHGKTKINAATVYGGAALAIETVKEFTGLPISHYIEIDFAGFKEVVDALGGVTVYVPERINDMEAAGYIRSAAVVEAGMQRLDGAKALTFVRTRDFPTGDLQRIENQQVFLRALLDEAFKAENVLRIPSLANAVAEQVMTDMTGGELIGLANQMRGMKDSSLQTVTMPGSPRRIGNGSYIVVDEEAFAAILERVKAGQPIVSATDPAPEQVTPEQVSVSVRNGAGIAGVANAAAARLKADRYNVVEIGNMNQFVYGETLVVYKGDDKNKAEMVVAALGQGRVVNYRGLYTFGSDVLLVIGRDWTLVSDSARHRAARH